MSNFFNVLPPLDALKTILDQNIRHVDSETIEASDSVGRISSGNVVSSENLPAFARSTMDGYFVRASDTFGASEEIPVYLELVGEVPTGLSPTAALSKGQAIKAYTGSMLPKGADAVVMVERTQIADQTTIEVLKSVAPGENVLQIGEDFQNDNIVVASGRLIRPQDVGGMMALGITKVNVSKRATVSIVSTGDELVPPTEKPGMGLVRDINSYTISACVGQTGAKPLRIGLVPDEFEIQLKVAEESLSRSDILILSAGSSVSSRDMTAKVFSKLGKPGVLVHGISVKPGKPTILALLDGKPAFGLPGNPVSALIVFDLVVRPTLYAIMGCAKPPPPPVVTATLTRDIPSESGREDYVPVRLVKQDIMLMAEPVFGKSNLINTLVKADGLVTIPLTAGGLYGGSTVDVRVC